MPDIKTFATNGLNFYFQSKRSGVDDNNFLTIDSPAIAAAYSKTFGDLGGPGHAASHSKGMQGAPTKVK